MRQDLGLQTFLQREKLLYFVMLRQLEELSKSMRYAYQLPADAASTATGWDPRTVILGWLEGELRTLRLAGAHQGRKGAQLMKAAVAL